MNWRSERPKYTKNPCIRCILMYIKHEIQWYVQPLLIPSISLVGARVLPSWASVNKWIEELYSSYLYTVVNYHNSAVFPTLSMSLYHDTMPHIEYDTVSQQHHITLVDWAVCTMYHNSNNLVTIISMLRFFFITSDSLWHSLHPYQHSLLMTDIALRQHSGA